MSHRPDLVESAFASLEAQDLDAEATFAAELRSRFIDEALESSRPAPERRSANLARRPAALMGWAAAVAIVVVTAVVIGPNSDALAIVQDARERFGELQSLRAVVEKVIPADQLSEEIGGSVADWTTVTEISFQDDRHWRREVIAEENNPYIAGSQIGSYQVFSNGAHVSFDASTGTFLSDAADARTPAQSRLDALLEMSPTLDQGEPTTDEAVRGCEVLDRQEVAGREAHHFECFADAGDGTVVDGVKAWIDIETGLVLKLTLPNGIRFEVLEIGYDVTFDDRTFSTDAPDDANAGDGGLNTGLEIGAEVPGWSLPLVGGGLLDLGSLRGAPTMVYLWATWCGEVCFGGPDDPLGVIDEAQSPVVNFVSMAVLDDVPGVESVVEQSGHTHRVVVAGAPLGQLWGDNGVPSLVVLDGAGRLLGAYVGDLQGDDLRLVLDAVTTGRVLPRLGGMTLSQLSG